MNKINLTLKNITRLNKPFLILLLITQHSFTRCSDRDLEVFKAIRAGTDFSKLSPEQNALYTTQINLKDAYGCDVPINTAIKHGNTSAVHWLLSKKVILNYELALRQSLRPLQDDGVKSEIVAAIVPYGTLTDLEVFGQTPMNYMQCKLDHYKDNPKLTSADKLSEIEKTNNLLKRYNSALLWTWITGAVVTTKTFDSERVKKVKS